LTGCPLRGHPTKGVPIMSSIRDLVPAQRGLLGKGSGKGGNDSKGGNAGGSTATGRAWCRECGGVNACHSWCSTQKR
jgi:hypothetical protein